MDWDALWAFLGCEGHIPGFNDIEDPNGTIDPWNITAWSKFRAQGSPRPLAPQWHQLVGMARMMERVLVGAPVLLMDSVGVGKTMQVVGVICLYNHFRRHFAKYKRFPGAFGEYYH